MILPALIAPAAIACACVVMGLLSRRLGKATRARPYYLGFFAAAALMLISGAARGVYAGHADDAASRADLLWILLLEGLPALALTLAVTLAWRYWSWLLAERA